MTTTTAVLVRDATSQDLVAVAALVQEAGLPLDGLPGAPVGLLTETADDYFPRFGFVPVPRDALPAVLRSSAEFSGACPASARALLRPAQR